MKEDLKNELANIFRERTQPFDEMLNLLLKESNMQSDLDSKFLVTLDMLSNLKSELTGLEERLEYKICDLINELDLKFSNEINNLWSRI